MQTGQISYKATYRRSAFALVALPALLILLGVGIFATIRLVPDGNASLPILLSICGAVLAGALLVLLTAFRVHRWSLEPAGLSIAERPKVPLTGLRRRVLLRYSDIAALRRLESGSETLIEVEAAGGALYHLPRRMLPGDGRFPLPDAAGLEAFAAAIQAARAASGAAPGPIGEALGFWNSSLGLAWQVVLLLMSLVIAAIALWSVWEGVSTRSRGGEAAAILILLPFGAGWLLRRSWRRRRAIHAKT